MINQERLKLMTKMAAYEEHDGKKNMEIISYFRSDYIGFQVLKSVICATIAFLILFMTFIFYDFEFLMQDMYKMDLMAFAQKIIIYYGIFVVIYGAISYIIFSIKFHKAKRSMKKYNNHLKQLTAMYDLENHI